MQSQRIGRLNARTWWLVGLVLAVMGLAGQACSLSIGMSPADADAHDAATARGSASTAVAPPTTPAGETIAAAPTADPGASPASAASAAPLAPLPSATPTPTPTPSPTPMVPARTPPDHIQAPSIGLDAPVRPVGWQETAQKTGGVASMWVVPDDAAGWHVNSAMPGHGGNIVMSGHHNLGTEVFRYLVDLKPGDPVVLTADGRAYTYVVTDRFILPERGMPEEQRRQNAQWIMPTVVERLTMVTCWPYTDNSHRVIVLASPAPGR